MPKRKREKKKQEESELEEEIEETESQEADKDLKKTPESQEIEENEFHEFMNPLEKSFSPVLERIEIPQQDLLEEDLAFAPRTQEKKDEKQIKYNESDYKIIEEESRRINENLLIRSTPINIETTRMNFHPQIEQNFQINPELFELRRKSEGSLEKDYVLKTERLERENNRLPFEQRERKYKGRAI